MIKRAETCETRRQEIFSVTDIFNFLTDEQINVFRNIEKINKKVVSLTYSIIFNETCLRERLLPTYTNIYIYMHICALKIIYNFRQC